MGKSGNGAGAAGHIHAMASGHQLWAGRRASPEILCTPGVNHMEKVAHLLPRLVKLAQAICQPWHLRGRELNPGLPRDRRKF